MDERPSASCGAEGCSLATAHEDPARGIAAMDSTLIRPVHDDAAKCADAMAAYDRERRRRDSTYVASTDPARRVVVVAMPSTMFGVLNPVERMGEFYSMYVFPDDTSAAIAVIAQ